MLEAHRLGVAAIRSEAAIPVGVTLALPDLQYEDGAQRGERSIELNSRISDRFFELARDDDFIGVQTYTRQRFGPEGARGPTVEWGKPLSPETETTSQLGQEIYPAALGNTIRRAWRGTGGVPILVTENGLATADDGKRIRFIRESLQEVLKTIDEGIDVRGYLHWSFIDNFEWSLGYQPTFGLVGFDRQTFERRLKPSADWLGRVARSRRID
jgi:beta-glucosidase